MSLVETVNLRITAAMKEDGAFPSYWSIRGSPVPSLKERKTWVPSLPRLWDFKTHFNISFRLELFGAFLYMQQLRNPWKMKEVFEALISKTSPSPQASILVFFLPYLPEEKHTNTHFPLCWNSLWRRNAEEVSIEIP